MEYRHLRYFLAVAEASSFNKAAAKLRVAQPALSRQVRDLEDEIGVNLVRRGPRGVTLTAEGKLFLEEVRELLKRTDESLEKVRALARGEFGELRVGYMANSTGEILPPGLAAFRKSVPRVNVSLYDLLSDEIFARLGNGTLELGIVAKLNNAQATGIEFELLRSYPLCVLLNTAHPFARLKSIPLEKVVTEPLVGLRHPVCHGHIDSIFTPIAVKPRIAAECDTISSLLVEVEAGRGIALSIALPVPSSKLVKGKRLIYRPLSGTAESVSIGIARAANSDVTPAGERFCKILRETSKTATAGKPKLTAGK